MNGLEDDCICMYMPSPASSEIGVERGFLNFRVFFPKCEGGELAFF